MQPSRPTRSTDIRRHPTRTDYLRLDHDRTRPLNVYVPVELRPWAAHFTIQKRPVLLYVQATTDTGARDAAIEQTRLIIRDQEEATFNRME